METTIPGYAYGAVAPSPVTLDDLAKLEATVMLTPEDKRALATAAEVLEPQVDDILDVWYGFVAANEHLVAYFSTPDGEPIGDYLEAVRARFGQWILDTCRRDHDADWLAYQEEIGLRHTAAKKNAADQAASVPLIHLRHVIGLIYPIVATMRDFLTKGGHTSEEVDAMHQGWFKSVVLQVSLWSRPYAGESW